MPSGRPKTKKALVDSILDDLVDPLADALATDHADGSVTGMVSGDARELARSITGTEIIRQMVWQVVEAGSDKDCGQQLATAVAELGEMATTMDVLRKENERLQRGLSGSANRAKTAALEPQAQLEAIAGLLAVRVPHEFRGREHEPVGNVVLDVLDRRLPNRDPRGFMGDAGWPGRRKPPKNDVPEMRGR